MGKIIVYNTKNEEHTTEPNNYYCGRSKDGNPLGNPYTHNGVKTNLAKLSLKTREEAIEAFGKYFDLMYGTDEELTKAFDEIYEHYKKGEDIYLQCFCKPLLCHCDIIADRLQRKLILDKMVSQKKKINRRRNRK